VSDPTPERRELAGLPGRARTYGVVLGSAASLALAALVVPLAFGHAPARSTAGGVATLTVGGPPADGAAPAAGSVAGPAGGPAGSSAAPTPGSLPGVAAIPGAPGAIAPAAPGRVTGAAPNAAPGGGDPATRAPAAPKGAPGSRPPAARGSGGTAGVPGAPAAPDTARTASDTGVTPDAVTLGVVVTDQGAAANLGATTGQSPQTQLGYYTALVTDINKRGGIGGRQVVLRSRTVNIVDSSSQQAACDSLATNDKAFAVLSLFGVYGAPILCFTNTYGIPYIANDGAVSSYYPKAGGRLFTTQPSTLRTLANSAYELQSRGELGQKSVVGVLREDDYLTADSLALEDYLRGFGHTVVDGATSATDVSQFPGQVAVAAQRFCAAGVTKVFLAVNSLYAAAFIRNVEQQINCTPSYYTSDFDYQMNGDTFVSGMPDSYFRRAIGVSSSRQGDQNAGRPAGATEQACIDSYVRGGGTRPDPRSLSAATLIGECGLVQTFARGLAAAGTNPTRASLAAALAGLGGFLNPGYTTSSFRSGKTDAPDGVRLVQADGGCKCWKPVGDGSFTPARFR